MADVKRWPKMYFKYDEGQMIHTVFNGPLEVPEGWYHSPKCFDEDGKVIEGMEPDIPGLEEAQANAGEEPSEKAVPEEYDNITVDELKEYLDENEVEYSSSDNKAALYDLYAQDFEDGE